jgi:2-oxoglutarate/2-oxoacid ferredoxin oxidoreductase subunit alpha
LDLQQHRQDVTCYPVPFDKLTAAVCPEARLRKLVKNMVYVGVVAKLITLDMAAVEAAVRKQFARKQKAADLNMAAVKAGYDYAEQSLVKKDPYFLERMHATEGKIIIDGNSAAALGAMFAGVTVVTWYPITPSSSVVEHLIDLMKKYRVEPDGKATFAIVQAEDELAAVGMVLGAGWAGARSMTATSGAARCNLRCTTYRPFNRDADAYLAGRSAFCCISLTRRHQARHAAPRIGEGVL